MAAEDEELAEAIRQNAMGPKTVSNDSGSATAHDLSDQLKVLDRLGNNAAARRGLGGLRFVKMIPPSAD